MECEVVLTSTFELQLCQYLGNFIVTTVKLKQRIFLPQNLFTLGKILTQLSPNFRQEIIHHRYYRNDSMITQVFYVAKSCHLFYTLFLIIKACSVICLMHNFFFQVLHQLKEKIFIVQSSKQSLLFANRCFSSLVRPSE